MVRVLEWTVAVVVAVGAFVVFAVAVSIMAVWRRKDGK